jgi:chromosome segregation protein
VLDLHPYVSIVSGLDEDQRAVLSETVAGLGNGRVITRGLIESHGVLFDLDAASLALLDLDSVGVDPVVHAHDLPGSSLSPTGRELRARQQALDDLDRTIERLRHDASRADVARRTAYEAVERVQRARQQAHADRASRLGGVDELTTKIDDLVEQRRRLSERLTAVRQEAEEATRARALAEDETAAVRAARRRAVDDATRLAAALDAERGNRDPLAATALGSAREALAEVERAVQLEREAEQARRARRKPSPAARLEQIDDRTDELRALLAVLVPADPAPVIDALELLRGEAEQEMVASPEAFTLADEIEKIEVRLAEFGTAPSADSDRVSSARAGLDDARAALVEAEQAVRTPELDREDIEALEHAHAAVLEAQDKAEARLGRGRARRNLDEARAAEREILERLGFATYADFMMGTSVLTVDPEVEAQLDEVRNKLVDAEDEWREVQLVLDAELERAALLDRRRDLRQRASRMLGSSRVRDIPAALRELRVPAVAGTDAANRLRVALDAVGLPIADEDLSDETLAKLAETWLEEDHKAAVRREEVVAELDSLAAERAVVAEEAASTPEVEAGELSAEHEARLAAARAVVADAEERVARSEAAEAAVIDLEEQLAAAVAREREAVAAATGADERVEDAVEAERASVERLAELEGEVASAAAAEEAAASELRRLESGLASDDDLTIDEQARSTALGVATERVEAASGALVVAEAEREAMAAEVERLHREHTAATGDVVPSADEVEWYLLARLAAQRSVSYAGSMPLLLDDALSGLDDIEVTRLLERIERMAASVQLIVVSESAALGAWANAAGLERAAMVMPEVSSAG